MILVFLFCSSWDDFFKKYLKFAKKKLCVLKLNFYWFKGFRKPPIESPKVSRSC
jgi:hypothetical protein